MDRNRRFDALDHLYSVYGRFIEERESACRPGCAHCCTRNVTLTSLEGARILDHLQEKEKRALLEQLNAEKDRPRFIPKLTTNRIARICIKGDALIEEGDADPSWGSCPFLQEDHLCPIYPVRPFGCRCMVSAVDCGKTGAAETAPFIITVNNVFLQYIEHLDAPGLSGNLTDLLLFLEDPKQQEVYGSEGFSGFDPEAAEAAGLIRNHPVPALMIPPKHRARIKPILDRLGAGP